MIALIIFLMFMVLTNSILLILLINRQLRFFKHMATLLQAITYKVLSDDEIEAIIDDIMKI